MPPARPSTLGPAQVFEALSLTTVTHIGSKTTDIPIIYSAFDVRCPAQVFEALSRMGLQGTEYGRKAIAAAKPASHTRPDNFTSEQRMAQR